MSALLFIGFIAVFIYMQGILYKRKIFENVTITRSFDSSGVFPGDKLVYEMCVENRKLLPLTWVSIDEKFYSGVEFEVKTKIQILNEDVYTHNTVLTLLPYQKVTRRYNLRARKRGFYQIKYISMASTNMLGTEEYIVEKEIPAFIAVYPNIRNLNGAIIPANTIQGDFSVKRWIIEDPMVITGVRDYVGNDSLRSVNWKATAKNQKLLVNKYDFTADKRIMIILNLERSEHSLSKEDTSALEAVIEVCASLAVMVNEVGIPVGFATNAHLLGPVESIVLDPDTGDGRLTDILEALAKVSYFKKYRSRELLQMMVADFSWGTEVIVVTPEISKALIADLETISNTKITVVSLSKSDVEVPSSIDVYYYKQEGDHYEAI